MAYGMFSESPLSIDLAGRLCIEAWRYRQRASVGILSCAESIISSMVSTSKQRTKRVRVTYNVSPEGDPIPDSVGSSSSRRRRSDAPVTTDPTPTRSVDGGFVAVPTGKHVARELSKLDDPCSKVHALNALKRLKSWLANNDHDVAAVVLESFQDYGGVARTLDFLEANCKDIDCVGDTAAILADFLSFRWNSTEEHREIANQLAKTIVRRRGIQLLLDANKNFVVGSTKKDIWIAIGRTVNGDETRRTIGTKHKFTILEDATDCIFQLESTLTRSSNLNSADEAWAANVLQVVLYAMANTMKESGLAKEELKRIDIVQGCHCILKRENWNCNEDVVTYALGILTICSNHKKMVKTKEFEQLLPSFIHCIRHFEGKSQIRSFVLALLESACEKVDKEKMERSGVLESISALLKQEGLNREVKEKARSIMRKILN